MIFETNSSCERPAIAAREAAADRLCNSRSELNGWMLGSAHGREAQALEGALYTSRYSDEAIALMRRLHHNVHRARQHAGPHRLECSSSWPELRGEKD